MSSDNETEVGTDSAVEDASRSGVRLVVCETFESEVIARLDAGEDVAWGSDSGLDAGIGPSKTPEPWISIDAASGGTSIYSHCAFGW